MVVGCWWEVLVLLTLTIICGMWLKKIKFYRKIAKETFSIHLFAISKAFVFDSSCI